MIADKNRFDEVFSALESNVITQTEYLDLLVDNSAEQIKTQEASFGRFENLLTSIKDSLLTDKKPLAVKVPVIKMLGREKTQKLGFERIESRLASVEEATTLSHETTSTNNNSFAKESTQVAGFSILGEMLGAPNFNFDPANANQSPPTQDGGSSELFDNDGDDDVATEETQRQGFFGMTSILDTIKNYIAEQTSISAEILNIDRETQEDQRRRDAFGAANDDEAPRNDNSGALSAISDEIKNLGASLSMPSAFDFAKAGLAALVLPKFLDGFFVEFLDGIVPEDIARGLTEGLTWGGALGVTFGFLFGRKIGVIIGAASFMATFGDELARALGIEGKEVVAGIKSEHVLSGVLFAATTAVLGVISKKAFWGSLLSGAVGVGGLLMGAAKIALRASIAGGIIMAYLQYGDEVKGFLQDAGMPESFASMTVNGFAGLTLAKMFGRGGVPGMLAAAAIAIGLTIGNEILSWLQRRNDAIKNSAFMKMMDVRALQLEDESMVLNREQADALARAETEAREVFQRISTPEERAEANKILRTVEEARLENAARTKEQGVESVITEGTVFADQVRRQILTDHNDVMEGNDARAEVESFEQIIKKMVETGVIEARAKELGVTINEYIEKEMFRDDFDVFLGNEYSAEIASAAIAASRIAEAYSDGTYTLPPNTSESAIDRIVAPPAATGADEREQSQQITTTNENNVFSDEAIAQLNSADLRETDQIMRDILLELKKQGEIDRRANELGISLDEYVTSNHLGADIQAAVNENIEELSPAAASRITPSALSAMVFSRDVLVEPIETATVQPDVQAQRQQRTENTTALEQQAVESTSATREQPTVVNTTPEQVFKARVAALAFAEEKVGWWGSLTSNRDEQMADRLVESYKNDPSLLDTLNAANRGDEQAVNAINRLLDTPMSENAKGTDGFVDFGRGQLSVLHGVEAVVPLATPAGELLSKFFNSDWQFNNELIGNSIQTSASAMPDILATNSIPAMKASFVAEAAETTAIERDTAQNHFFSSMPSFVNSRPQHNNTQNTTNVYHISPTRTLDDPSIPK